MDAGEFAAWLGRVVDRSVAVLLTLGVLLWALRVPLLATVAVFGCVVALMAGALIVAEMRTVAEMRGARWRVSLRIGRRHWQWMFPRRLAGG